MLKHYVRKKSNLPFVFVFLIVVWATSHVHRRGFFILHGIPDGDLEHKTTMTRDSKSGLNDPEKRILVASVFLTTLKAGGDISFSQGDGSVEQVDGKFDLKKTLCPCGYWRRAL